MNWKVYFDLQDKKKKSFKRFFIFFLILNLFFIRGFIFSGQEGLCDKLFVRDNDVVGKLLDTENVNNPIGGFSNSSLVNQTNTTLIEGGFKIPYFIWFDCGVEYDSLDDRDKFELWLYRGFYTPLLLVSNMVIAFIFSSIVHFFRYRKAAKDDEGEEKEEPKEDDKKKKK